MIPDDDAPQGRGAPSFEWEFSAEARGGVGRSLYTPGGTEDASRFWRREGGKAVDAGRHRDRRSAPDRGAQPRRDLSPEDAPQPAHGSVGRARANYIRHQLDLALDQWWAESVLPPPALLRAGLELLEAGGTLAESHLTLLLRSALAYGRGVHTALKHQHDSERVGVVMAEALVDWEPPFELADRVVRDAIGHPDVLRALVSELRRRVVESTGAAKARATEVLGLLTQPVGSGPVVEPAGHIGPVPRVLRQLIFLALVATVIAFVVWQWRAANPVDMVKVAGGVYATAPANAVGPHISVEVAPFLIDRLEVTNANLRACISAGACPWPSATHSSTRVDYFTNPAFDDFPVVHVRLDAAQAYCAWRNKRLPSAAEWTAAAGGEPVTSFLYRYPWGEQFDPQRANSAETGSGDTVLAGNYRPAGDSPAGAADMAGNVAEWTSSGDAKEGFVVKGGSYADDRLALQVGAEQRRQADAPAAWVGFRCARSERSP